MRRRKLREPFVFFVDECLGRRIVPDALRAAKEQAERVETLPQGTLDVDWLPKAGNAGWVCFTKDRRLSRAPNELAALLSAGIAVFMLGYGSGPEHASRIVRALPVVRRVLRSRKVPLIARIDPDLSISVLYEGGVKITPPRRMTPKASERPKDAG
ncbi:MAG: hypothetical protein U0263_15720 [Polyangiaceae bacterium]